MEQGSSFKSRHHHAPAQEEEEEEEMVEWLDVI